MLTKKEIIGKKEKKIMRKGIIIGIGILIILLALAGTGSALPGGFAGNFNCNGCHPSITPGNATFYNQTHRYNATVINPPYCDTCHVDVSKKGTVPDPMNFTLRTGNATYLNSSVCETCHKKKYDDWYGTMHRVMLTNKTKAQAMNLPVPPGYTWSNISYVIVGKPELRYLNETGYRFKRYYTENETFANYSGSYSCGGCHTTGYDPAGANESGLVGIVGNWSEEGITCENCHGPGGNGHNVTIYKKGEDCLKCHDTSSRQGLAMTNRHATAPAEESMSRSCTQCHSPYNKYEGIPDSYENAANVTCSVCHNPHSTTDDKYEGLLSPGGFNNTSYAVVEEVKLSFFNGTASNISKYSNTSVFTGTNASLTAGNDVYDLLITPALLYSGSSLTINGTRVKDASYGSAPINVIGPQSELLCSMCHYRHGLAHMTSVNLSHGRNQPDITEWATCVDCHMSKAGGKADHSFGANNATNYPQNTCSTGTKCHVTSAQNQSISNISIVPVETEWEASAHNNAAFVSTNNTSGCAKCHSPMNWNTNASRDNYTIETEDYKGIKCVVCHNIHDMGNWINNTGNVYAKYNKYSSSTGNYTVVANTTELCGNCHSNKPDSSTAGWNGSGPHNSVVPHNSEQKDIFVGSWKSTETLVAKGRNYECSDCHIYINMSVSLTDSQKSGGHNYIVNATNLQTKSECSGCHDGVNYVTIPSKISSIQTTIQTKWNTTNTTVESAWTEYNAELGPKSLSGDKLAQAFYKLYQVKNDGSWGVHDRVATNTLLDEAATLAADAVTALGTATSNVDLVTGWNLVALNGTTSALAPVSALASVSSNVTVAWGFNATSKGWEVYDPAMPTSLDTLKTMVPGKGYWLYAIQNCKWTV